MKYLNGSKKISDESISKQRLPLFESSLGSDLIIDFIGG